MNATAKKKRLIRVGVLVAVLFIGLEGVLLLWPRLSQTQRLELARIQCSALCEALKRFRADRGRYPSPEEGLASLAAASQDQDWEGAYLDGAHENEHFLDPWGQPYEYVLTRETVGVRSAGPDMLLGSPDDIQVSIDGGPSGGDGPL